MRNLVLRERRLLQLAPVDLAGPTLFHCVNEEAGCVYCIGENLVLSAHRLSDGKVGASLSLEPELVEPPVPGTSPPSPTSLHWSPDLGAVLVTLATGELITVQGLDEGLPVATSPGAVQGGILAAAWSPDGQLLSIVSGRAQVLLLNADWAVLSESPIPGAASPLSKAAVSWRGDGAAFATVFSSSDASCPSSLCVWDRDGGAESAAEGEAVLGLLPVVSYQPNGRHIYAVSAHAAAPPASEPAAEPAAAPEAPAEEQQRRVSAWRFEERRKAAAKEAEAAESEAQWGSGALAGRVTLFERNGLTHGCFAVPRSAAGAEKDADEITHMAWSPDSSVLAIVVLRGAWSTVQCWTRSNWHWYLKLELPLHGRVASLSWRDLGLALDCSTSSGTLLTATLAWAACPSHWGSVVVVDGRWLRAHQLAWQVLPPPLCAGSLQLCGTPLGACWVEQEVGGEGDGSVRSTSSLPSERLALLMPDASLLLVSCRRSADDGECEEDVLLSVVARVGPEWMGEIDLDGLGQFATHPLGALVFVASLSPNVLGVGLASTHGGARLALLGLSLDEVFESRSSATDFEAPVEDLVPRWVELAPLSEPVLSCGRGIIQTASGKLHAQLDCNSASLRELDASAAFPSPCFEMQPTPLASLPPALGLSDRGVLYWGSHVLAQSVTSFAVRWQGPGGPYLLFTTRDHTMVSVPLSAQLFARRAPSVSPAALPCASSRNVEHGALLVAAAGGSTRWDRATYQTPRGNLETVAVRPLVLESLAALLERGRVAAAMKAATQHAVDLNFVADLAWPRFLNEARRCVDQCDPEALADFVTALAERSCVAEGGEYAWAPCVKRGAGGEALKELAFGDELADTPDGAPAPLSKIDAICGALRAALWERETERSAEEAPELSMTIFDRLCASSLRPLLASYARQGDLGAALALVRRAKEAELAADERIEEHRAAAGGRTVGSRGALAGLKFLLLTHPEQALVDAALGLYDVELAYMVVSAGQRDPAEALLDLKSLAGASTEARFRAGVDALLRRPERQLRALLVEGEAGLDEALALAEQHGLWRLLLTLLDGAEPKLSSPRPAPRSPLDALLAQAQPAPLPLPPVTPAQRSRARAAYAASLASRRRGEDSALVLLSIGDREAALEAYASGLHWRPALALAGALRRDAGALAARMAEDLASDGRAAEGGRALLEAGGGLDAAVPLLTQGGAWAEALHACWRAGRADLVDRCLGPSAARRAAEVLEESAADEARVVKYAARLGEVVARRAALDEALRARAGEGEEGEEEGRPRTLDWDAASEAGSTTSQVSALSAYTDASVAGGSSSIGGDASQAPSTVGGRRAGKKPAKRKGKSNSSRIRQGSPQEERQLCDVLLGLAPSAALLQETGELCQALVALGCEQDARRVQDAVGRLLEAQARAGKELLARPPPSLQDPAAPGKPGPEVQARVAEAERIAAQTQWKWDLLRA